MPPPTNHAKDPEEICTNITALRIWMLTAVVFGSLLTIVSLMLTRLIRGACCTARQRGNRPAIAENDDVRFFQSDARHEDDRYEKIDDYDPPFERRLPRKRR